MTVEMIDQDSLRTLIDRAKGGDREAFNRLVEGCGRQVETAVLSFVDPKLRGNLAVEELVQETFVIAFESIDSFEWRSEGSLVAWLGGIARNVVYTAVRKARKKRPLEIVRNIAAGDPSPSKVVRRGERFDRLKTAFRDLSEDYREVLTLARIEGLPVSEISKRMGRSPEAIRQLLSRAIKQLRKSFGDTESLHLPDRRFMEEVDDGE